MKKIILGALFTAAVFVTTFQAFAQTPEEIIKDLKAASKALTRYNMDGEANAADIKVAKEKIDAVAAKSSVIEADAKNYIKYLSTRANVYLELGKIDQLQSQAAATAAKKYDTQYFGAGLEASDALAKLLSSTAASKGDKRDALEGIETAAIMLNNEGIKQYETQKYADAYKSFSTVITLKKAADGSGPTKFLDTPKKLNDELYFSALSAYQAKMPEQAAPLMEDLVAKGYEPENNKAMLYNVLTSIYLDKNKEKALAILDAGRKKYPDDTQLLFAEINYYISQNQLDALEDKIKAAIGKEPNNKSLHYVMAKVYDSKHEKEEKAGNTQAAAESFAAAESAYLKAIELDPKYAEALYSIATIYFNKAANKSQEMKTLGISKKEQERYDVLNKDMKDLFEKALPYFLRAEAQTPTDANTLQALRDIYAKKGDAESLKKSQEYKARFEAVKGKVGGLK